MAFLISLSNWQTNARCQCASCVKRTYPYLGRDGAHVGPRDAWRISLEELPGAIKSLWPPVVPTGSWDLEWDGPTPSWVTLGQWIKERHPVEDRGTVEIVSVSDEFIFIRSNATGATVGLTIALLLFHWEPVETRFDRLGIA